MSRLSITDGLAVRDRIAFILAAAVAACLMVADSPVMASSGDHLWNLRENHQVFFADNDSWVRPWQSGYGYDTGWGSFVGGHNGYFLWDPMGAAGNSIDGSLSLNRGVSTQFHLWTYLYVSVPKTISLTGEGDCVPRWFLNYQFDSPHEFIVGDPTDIGLSAGWNRLDITGYNQNSGFLFESSPLASQVSIMNTLPVPEPSTLIVAIASILVVSALKWLARQCNRRLGVTSDQG
jgi:hypothetical protein